MKKTLQNLFNFFGYNIIKSKNFRKISRTLDYSIKSQLKNNSPLIIDVGAHQGESIKRFKKLFLDPEIHSFEPQVEQFKILKRLKSNKIYLNNCGIGSKNENKNIFVNSETAASSYLNLVNEDNYFRNIKTINKEQTVLKTIDYYLNEKKITFVDLMKIDVQGYENEVLKGATNSLEKIHLIEIEIVFVNYYEQKNSFYEIEKILTNHNFELFSLSSLNLNKSDDSLRNLDALYINREISN